MPLLTKDIKTTNWFASDSQFNQLYPAPMQLLAKRHFTPLVVAKKVAEFLAAETDVRILDIGSGVGKFCLAAAHYQPKAFYYGIEQRKNLSHHAEAAKKILDYKNVFFLNGNFTQVDFEHYDHFYLYYSFYENLTATDKIDDSIDYSPELFKYYNRYLLKHLEQKPPGTKLATYHCLEDEMPPGYQLVGDEMDSCLKLWIKI